MTDVLGLLLLLFIAATLLFAGVVASILWTATRPRRETAAWAVARGLPADPEDAGLEAETWTVRRPDGAELHAWTIESPGPFEPGAPRVPLIVLAHGWYRGRRSMLGRLGPFLPLAERVVLYDARGHGESGGRSALGAREADDLLAVIEAAGGGPAVVGGWSLGGSAALAAAATAGPDRVAGVVAIAPVVDMREAIAARMRQFEVAPWLLGPAVRLGLRWLGAWPAPIDPARIAVPTVIVHGVQDVVCPIEGVRVFAAGVRGGRLVELAEAGHDEPEQADSEGVRAAVAEIVARVISAA